MCVFVSVCLSVCLSDCLAAWLSVSLCVSVCVECTCVYGGLQLILGVFFKLLLPYFLRQKLLMILDLVGLAKLADQRAPRIQGGLFESTERWR